VIRYLCVILLLISPGSIGAATLDSSFEGGNGVPASTFENPAGTFNVVTECDPSPAATSWGDWFYFALSDVIGTAPVVRVDFNNTRSGGPYWPGTHGAVRPVYSYDQQTWYRLASIDSYSGEVLQFTLPILAADTVYIAMDHPYTWSDLVADVAGWDASAYCQVSALSHAGVTHSQGGRNVYYMLIEEPGYYTNRFEMVITGRSHPGEPQASHAMAGFLDWILSSNAAAVELRRKSVLHVFPMNNPDGVWAGRSRSMDNGLDGNRGWDVGGPNSSTEPPETFLIHSKIDEVQANVTVCFDFHSNNYSEPRLVYDATYDDWIVSELDAIVVALNTNDVANYLLDSAFNMVTDYNTNFRRGQIESYGYNALGIEGGIYAMESGAYPTVVQRETGGAVVIQSIIEAMENSSAITLQHGGCGSPSGMSGAFQ
jgi:hypothetical protein